MEFETLKRPKEDYLWAVLEMAKCPTLSVPETSLLIDLGIAADSSTEEFDIARREAMMYRPRVVASIINKCMAAGFPMKWPHDA